MSTFNLIREVINISLLALLIVSILFIFKKKSKLFKILLAVCYVLIRLVVSFPLENLVINYSTPEDVFRYAQTGNIESEIYGDASCMVIYQDNNSYSALAIPKNDKGYYKIPDNRTTTSVLNNFQDKNYCSVYNVNNTEDYYLSGYYSFQTDNMFSVSDSINSDFEIYSQFNNTSNDYTFYYFAKIDTVADDYYIIINNQKFYLK